MKSMTFTINDSVSEAVSYAMATGASPKKRQSCPSVTRTDVKQWSGYWPSPTVYWGPATPQLSGPCGDCSECGHHGFRHGQAQGLKKWTPPHPPPLAASAQTKVSRFEVDRLEQYNCGENITINGLLETARENTSEVVVKLGREIGVEVTRGDISERLESWEI